MNHIIRTIILLLITLGAYAYSFHLGFFSHEAYNFFLLGSLAFVLLIPNLNFISNKIRIPFMFILLITIFILSTRHVSSNNLFMLAIVLLILGIFLTLRMIYAQAKHDHEKIKKEKELLKQEKEKLKQEKENIKEDNKEEEVEETKESE